MQVDRVKATIRYSQDTGKGAWRSLEIGAEANLDPNETMDDAQAELYTALRHQFKALWNAGAKGQPEADPQLPLEPQPEAPAPDPDRHWCDVHDQEFKRREKDGRVWYSHYLGNRQYCNEND